MQNHCIEVSLSELFWYRWVYMGIWYRILFYCILIDLLIFKAKLIQKIPILFATVADCTFLYMKAYCICNLFGQIRRCNRHFPNLLECTQNNSMKLRRAMLTATKQWFTLPVLISCYCFVCTQANSGSVYWSDKIYSLRFRS